ncbi:MAG: GTPase ObgE [Planctomycetes bacterium]|nr:GTPase ObgE [Planctomycetota bacterium]
MFKDEVTVYVRAGNGGQGCVSFRREKYIPMGGPDGGNGGKGGDIILTANPHLNTLYHLSHHQRLIAPNGQPGGSNNCTGKDGKDLVIEVPPGTVIRDREHQNILKDLKESGDSIILCEGGRGGRGNKVFATSTNQSPRYADKGAPGEERWLYLELKLIADVGLVGLPNAGKSTIITRLSAARPKIAPYPFTTLEPSLGIVAMEDDRSFVMADLPGLIEGASHGRGLGDKFLRHIERTKLVAHIIDGSSAEPLDMLYKIIRKELSLYSPKLAKKPAIVVVNKMDLPEAASNFKKYRAKLPRGTVAVSAIKRTGLETFLKQVWRKL